MKFEPRSFIYLDSEGIESLYAQIVDRLEKESKQKTERGTAGTAKGSFSLGKLLGQVIGLGSVNAESSVSKDKKQSEEVTTVLTIEHKLARFIDYLEESDPQGTYTSMERAAAKCAETDGACFVCCKDKFNMPQFYGGKDGLQSVNKSLYVEFEIGEPLDALSRDPASYDPSDNYYKNAARPRVVMSASVLKFPRSGGKLSRMGHDAPLFIGYKGLQVPLFVLAEMSKVDLFFRLKPFAIWR